MRFGLINIVSLLNNLEALFALEINNSIKMIRICCILVLLASHFIQLLQVVLTFNCAGGFNY